jgi:hypothetical protein
VRLEGLGKLKNSTSSVIEPATLRLVVQCLNQLRYRVRPLYVHIRICLHANLIRLTIAPNVASSTLRSESQKGDQLYLLKGLVYFIQSLEACAEVNLKHKLSKRIFVL